METTSKRRLRSTKTATDGSPLRELPATTRQRTRVASSTSKKKNDNTENDNAESQSQQHHAHHHTSPSQSPQPHESHSEPEQVAESRSTSPPDQQPSSQHYTRQSTRSVSPSRLSATTGKKVTKSKANNKKGSVGRPKRQGPAAHQSIGVSKTPGAKRAYKNMADASDADGEEAGDERPSTKHHWSISSPVQNTHIYKDENVLKRKHESSSHQGADSTDSETDSAVHPTKRHRTSESSKIPTPTRKGSSPRSYSFSNGPFSYAGTPLVASPSAQNPFALVPAHQPFGSSRKHASPSQENHISQRSPIAAQVSNSLLSDNTQFVAIDGVSSTPSSSQQLIVRETTIENDAAVSSANTPRKRSVLHTPFRQSGSAGALERVENTPPHIAKSIQTEARDKTQTPHTVRKSGSAQASSQLAEVPGPSVNNHSMTEEPQESTARTQLIQSPSSNILNAPSPFVFHVKERLPPKPSTNNQRQIPTLPKPSTPFIHHNSNNTFDFDESMEMSDDDAEVDLEVSKQKSRAWKEDYQKLRALQKQTKLAMEKLARGERLGPEFGKKVSSPGDVERRKQVTRTPASRNSTRISSQPILIFPAIGYQEEIRITDTRVIGFLRAVHSHVAAGDPTNTLPDPQEVVALLQNSTTKQSSKTRTLIGQKAGTQHDIDGSTSIIKVPNQGQMDQPEDDLSTDEDQDDTVTDITLRADKGEVPATPAPKSGGWLSSFKSGVQSLMTPFSFKGSSNTANVPETEFTFSHEHSLQNTQTTPTRVTRPKVKAQSERRSRTQSSRTAIAQTERKRRVHPKNPPSFAPLPPKDDPEYQRIRTERALKTALEYEARVKAERAQAAAQEFANATSKARAQSRSERNVEVEVEDHNHGRSFAVPDDSGDSSDDDMPPQPDSPLAQRKTRLSSGQRLDSPNAQRKTRLGNDQTHEETPDTPDSGSNNRSTFRVPSPVDGDDDSDKEEAGEPEHDAPVSTSTALVAESVPFNQSPPPKPRPGNAQLPLAPVPAVNTQYSKYAPKKPSGLRNVTAMSPLAKESDDEEGWARIQQAVNQSLEEKPLRIGSACQDMYSLNGETDERVLMLGPEYIQRAVMNAL